MGDEEQLNGSITEQEELLSILGEKRKELLDELGKLMEQLGAEYGPVLMEELQRRLEFVVLNFNTEVKNLFFRSFETWKVKDIQLRDLMDEYITISKAKTKKRKSKDQSTPEFIKDVEFGPVRPK